MTTAVTIIVAILGGLNITQLIIFLVNRHDSKKNVEGKLVTLEKDVVRTQLLLMILMRPDAKQEILTVGEHYFGKLHGDWYMTSVFNQWLQDSGLIYKVNKVSAPSIPLHAYTDLSSYKIYMLDTGLLGALGELDWRTILEGNHAFVEFKGALTEQYVLQQLIAETPYHMYYYSTEKSAYEVDFLFQKNGEAIPLEVKAEENLKAKSLKMYVEKYHPAEAIRTSMSGYRKQDWLTNIPLWAIQSL